jgi:hypothetical protein
VDPRTGLNWCGKSRLTGIRSPDRPSLLKKGFYEIIRRLKLGYAVTVATTTTMLLLQLLLQKPVHES